ncbi:hypothetical protein ACIODT_36820 [Streptomyces sp. NPDC088251]
MGVLAKRLGSAPGTHQVRCVRTAEAIVGGWVPGRGRLAGLPGAFLVGE